MDCLHILMKPNIIVNIDPVMRQALRLAGRQVRNKKLIVFFSLTFSILDST